MTKIVFGPAWPAFENGARVYSILMKNENTERPVTVGFLSKTLRKTWQVDIAAHATGRTVIKETAKFADAKRMARELLA